ncbi:MAG: YbaK/EbsC family protein [Actinomycetota bacterium]
MEEGTLRARLDPLVADALDHTGVGYEILPCEEHLADTEEFTRHYGWPLDRSANTILVVSKRGPKRFAACVLLADNSLDVNGAVRREMGVSKASFAKAEETAELTGMRIGGVTPFGLHDDVPVLVHTRVMERDWIILGSGNRLAKIKLSPEVFEHLPNARVVPDLAR